MRLDGISHVVLGATAVRAARQREKRASKRTT